MKEKINIKRGVQAALIITYKNTKIITDPGFFGYPSEVNDADLVLVTRDHFDHVDLPSLKKSLEINPKLKVFSPTPLDLKEQSSKVTIVSQNDKFLIGDLTIEVVGKYQSIASIDDDPIDNVGYLIDGRILHPGDARPEIEGI